MLRCRSAQNYNASKKEKIDKNISVLIGTIGQVVRDCLRLIVLSDTLV
jgi:hypothetical protein